MVSEMVEFVAEIFLACAGCHVDITGQHGVLLPQLCGEPIDIFLEVSNLSVSVCEQQTVFTG